MLPFKWINETISSEIISSYPNFLLPFFLHFSLALTIHSFILSHTKTIKNHKSDKDRFQLKTKLFHLYPLLFRVYLPINILVHSKLLSLNSFSSSLLYSKECVIYNTQKKEIKLFFSSRSSPEQRKKWRRNENTKMIARVCFLLLPLLRSTKLGCFVFFCYRVCIANTNVIIVLSRITSFCGFQSFFFFCCCWRSYVFCVFF